MDGPTHLLTLKVMRVSRPELASAWQPFYSSSPSFSAHSTASIVSLQGNSPLPGHPKTLRDLTHASELLTLPSSFGSIQLGETFSCVLCINNEAHGDVEAVGMKVEMQTATSKVVLAEFGGPEHTLSARDTFECVINHEIKELGQHVLACCVTYRLPPNAHRPQGAEQNIEDPFLQTFRKFYKFAVTNPLSVKTKVHIPRSPSALLSPAERDKVFLEVHIQNLTQEPMHFERMQFECAEGWNVKDANIIDVDSDEDEDEKQLFSGSLALMQPQDIRQYIYILTPKSSSLIPAAHVPGSILPLGRLDIFWRSSFGEPGRLLTSMLSRRIPIPPVPTPQPSASALPPYLKRGTPPSRPQSPQLIQSRPNSPPLSRSSIIAPPGSLSPFQAPIIPMPDVEVNLIVRQTPQHPIRVEEPFAITFALVLSSSVPLSDDHKRRAVRLVVQHLQPPRVSAPLLATPAPAAEASSPRLPSSGFSTPSSATATFNYALAHQKLTAASSPRQPALDGLTQRLEHIGISGDTVSLPPPFFQGVDELKHARSSVLFVGSSVLHLPIIELSASAVAGHTQADQATAVQEFQLSYLPLQKGYTTVGGLRVLLIDDRFIGVGESLDDASQNERRRGPILARILKEWDIVSEVWVSP